MVKLLLSLLLVLFFRWSCSLVVFTSSWSKFSTGTYFHLDYECSCLKFRRRKNICHNELCFACVCVSSKLIYHWVQMCYSKAIFEFVSISFQFFFYTEFATLLLASDVCHLSFRYNNEIQLTGTFLCVCECNCKAWTWRIPIAYLINNIFKKNSNRKNKPLHFTSLHDVKCRILQLQSARKTSTWCKKSVDVVKRFAIC